MVVVLHPLAMTACSLLSRKCVLSVIPDYPEETRIYEAMVCGQTDIAKSSAYLNILF